MDNAWKEKDYRINPTLALIGGVLAISTGAIFIRLAADAPALVIAAYRVGIATLMILPISVFKARDELLNLSSAELKTASLAGFFLALHFAAWVSSLKFTSVANSVVLVNTSPLWVGIFAPLITKEKIKRPVLLSIFMSIFGAFVIGYGDYVSGSNALAGDFLALAGGFCMAGYLLMGRKLRQKLSLIAYVSVCYGSSAILLWSLVILLGFPIWGFSGQTVAAFFSMALFPQLIGHSCYNWALKYFSTSFIAISLLGEPVGSTFLAYMFFHEGLSLMKITGGVFILTAIYIVANSEAS
jgi:drug/metabolite transporter (DMT)-like permease